MRIHACVRRLLVVAASMSMLAATGGTAWADTSANVTVVVTAGAPPGICSVLASAVTGDFTSDWIDTGTGGSFWSPISGTGSMTLTFDSTGAPGDRDCYANGTNSDFVNGSAIFLPSTSLSLSYQGNFAYQRSDAVPIQPILVPTQNLPDGGSAFDLAVHVIGIPHPDVPAGPYTSTLTITVSSVSP